MSATWSPACPARSLSPVLNEEEAELQAYLAAAQREAQEKWKRLREEKALGGGAGECKIVEEKGVVEEHVDDVVGEETEVVPKVESRPQKVASKMVAGLPRSREVIPIILIPKKRRNVVEVEVAESSHKRRKVVQILTPTPSLSPFLVPASVAFVATRFVGLSPTLPTRSLVRGATLCGKVARSSRSRRNRGFDPHPMSLTGRRKESCVMPSRS
ncbi:hypothetical protein GGU10DRAFT_382042 [Lentinula aff. detonsa]|uniref:Uncharacterized protein n=1 Tax=Lentinula aff. detonsa TaxID=2804958 RepID=A0AA38KSR0_9AGAR|nr:hypothetical protein GGU10DRAFT_382042 [Lentinula aff. detonsa]